MTKYLSQNWLPLLALVVGSVALIVALVNRKDTKQLEQETQELEEVVERVETEVQETKVAIDGAVGRLGEQNESLRAIIADLEAGQGSIPGIVERLRAVATENDTIQANLATVGTPGEPGGGGETGGGVDPE